MAFIPEDGSGLVDSNSIVDVAFADVYWADRDNKTWSTKTVTQKQVSLIQATDYLENNYSYKGKVLVEAQALEFPRTDIFVRGVVFEGIPNIIKEVCVELADRTFSGELFPDPVVNDSALGSITEQYVKAGPVEKTTKYDPAFKATFKPIFNKVEVMLIKSGLLLNTTGGVIRV